MSELEAPFNDEERGYSRKNKHIYELSFEQRLSFIRYTYFLLTFQFLVSLALSCAAISSRNSGFGYTLGTNIKYVWIPIVAALPILMFVGCYPNSFHNRAISLCCFALFTSCKAFAIAMLAAWINKPIAGNLVFIIITMLATTALCLALYALKAKKRFEMFNGGVAIYAPGFIMLAVFFFTMEVPFFYLFFCLCGTILFGVIILLETKTITESDHLLTNYAWGTLAYYLGPFVVFWACVEAVSPVKKRRQPNHY